MCQRQDVIAAVPVSGDGSAGGGERRGGEDGCTGAVTTRTDPAPLVAVTSRRGCVRMEGRRRDVTGIGRRVTHWVPRVARHTAVQPGVGRTTDFPTDCGQNRPKTDFVSRYFGSDSAHQACARPHRGI